MPGDVNRPLRHWSDSDAYRWHRDRLTRDRAFNVLRLANQCTNRKFTDIAAEVTNTETGPFDLRPEATTTL